MTAGMTQRIVTTCSSAESVLKLALFYGMFLPLAERCSVDAGVKMADNFCNPSATNRQSSKKGHFSAASVGLVVQFMIIYISTGTHKAMDPTWKNGEAAFNAMALPTIARPLVRCLIVSPALARGLTYMTLVIELAVPAMWLVLGGLSDWMRVGLLVALAGMHVVVMGVLLEEIVRLLFKNLYLRR